MDKKYFFFDFDGTLAVGTTGKIVDSAKRTLKRLEENGHFVALATGRLQADAMGYCEALGVVHMVSDGGNGITIQGKLVRLDPIDHPNSLQLLKELEKKGISWAVTTENIRRRYCRSEQFIRDVQDDYMETIVIPDLDFDKMPQFYKIYIGCNEKSQQEIESLQFLPHVRFSPRCLFIEGDDKSAGIKKTMELLRAPVKDVVVFGDGANDLKMFLDEWTSIAMGNARDELKAKADFVTKRCEEDGVEYACQYFGWI